MMSIAARPNRAVRSHDLPIEQNDRERTGASGYQLTLTLDIVDYPGEWLLDLPLLTKSYEVWACFSAVQSDAIDPFRTLASSVRISD
jgi:predicted YcjX-like family ATPase